MLLSEKYAPKKLDELEGNDEIRVRIRQWMLGWISGKRQRPLLLWGPAGIGKTAAPYALAKEYDLDILEMNASQYRDRERVERVLHGATLAGSLTGRGKIILMDDADAMLGRNDSGGNAAMLTILRECAAPIIVTATDAWDKKMTGIRSECESLEMKRVNRAAVTRMLNRIAAGEGLNADYSLIDKISAETNGDVRSAINDFQAGVATVRDREKDIFTRVRSVFKATTLAEAREATSGDADLDLLKLWIDENIPAEYEDAEDVAAAYHWLSRADIFEGRIRKTYWKYLRYALDLQTAGVALAKKRPYRKFTKYMFPSYLRGMSASMQRRALLKSIGLKVGSKVHTNRREALEYLPLLREMAKGREDDLVSFYRLEEDEIAFIMETAPRKVRRTKKVEEE